MHALGALVRQPTAQWELARSRSTIDSGALAERVNFWAYLLASSICSGILYPGRNAFRDSQSMQSNMHALSRKLPAILVPDLDANVKKKLGL